MSLSSRFLCAGVLSLGLAFVPPAQADAPPSLFGAARPENNGFDLFEQAVKLYAGGLGSSDNLNPADLIRYERGNVARNRDALKKIREGLALPVLHPVVNVQDTDFSGYDDLIKLAKLLVQEANVRYSNGDWIGAMNSHLDCIQLGVVITRGGPLQVEIPGRKIEEIGRANLGPIVKRLTIEECKDMAARVAKIEALRPAFADWIRLEQKFSTAETREAFDKLDWSQVVATKVKPNGDTFTDAEKEVLTNAGQEDITGNLDKALKAAVAFADGPYRPVTQKVPAGIDPWSKMMVESFTSPTYRIDYEWLRTQNLLLQFALQLYATRSEVGAYPETLDLPVDPYGNGEKLKYRREGESYLLYSVGPNGKDDNGQPADLAAEGGFNIDTTGDLPAPVFF